jgi:hypothetical protein
MLSDRSPLLSFVFTNKLMRTSYMYHVKILSLLEAGSLNEGQWTIKGKVSLLIPDSPIEEDNDYGQFVGHESSDYLDSETIYGNRHVNMNTQIEEESDNSQVLGTIIAAILIIAISIMVNESSDAESFIQWVSSKFIWR